MAESSLPWGGSSTGDAGPYSSDTWNDMMACMLGAGCSGVGNWGGIDMDQPLYNGVLASYSYGLMPQKVSNTVVRIKPGAALVNGTFYKNTADIDLTFSSTGYYTIVLRKTWSSQTVRTVVSGPNASTYPSCVLNVGTVYEIPIARVHYVSSPQALDMYDRRKIPQPFPLIERFWSGGQPTPGAGPNLLGTPGNYETRAPVNLWCEAGTQTLTMGAGLADAEIYLQHSMPSPYTLTIATLSMPVTVYYTVNHYILNGNVVHVHRSSTADTLVVYINWIAFCQVNRESS